MKENKFLSKTEYVYRELKEKIADGSLDKGELYTVIDIAEAIGVSRTPVSGAVKVLEAEGHVVLYPGVGFKIKELTINEVEESLMIAGALEKVLLKEIIVAKALDDKTYEQLLEIASETIEASDQEEGELYVSKAAEFHSAFYQVVELPKLKRVLKEHVFMHDALYKKAVEIYPQGIKKLARDHYTLINNVKKDDMAGMYDAMNAHIQNCYETLKFVLSKGGIL